MSDTGQDAAVDDVRQVEQAIERDDAGELVALLMAVGEPVAAIEAVPAAADTRTWLSLDLAARWWWHQDLRVDDDLTSLGWVMAGSHPDGHVREAAIEHLMPQALALRAADWVPQVRERARRACAGRSFLALAPMALALRHRRRVAGSPNTSNRRCGKAWGRPRAGRRGARAVLAGGPGPAKPCVRCDGWARWTWRCSRRC
jgi:hypothetical protein